MKSNGGDKKNKTGLATFLLHSKSNNVKAAFSAGIGKRA